MRPCAVSGDPFGGGAQPGQARDQADAPVAELGEMGDQPGHRLGVLGADLVEARGPSAAAGRSDTRSRNTVGRRAGPR